ncbi:MAG TPA: Ig-like domain-containing protein, partial [Opitutus sp.]|nr:Ig-like domain-containing protein [Opitutus sp.]
MRRSLFTVSSLGFSARGLLRVFLLTCLLALTPAWAADAAAPADEAEPIVSMKRLEFDAEDGGVYGQLVFADELQSTNGGNDLVFTITEEPLHGRVGLAGGDDSDFFKNKTSRLGYFAYRADDDYQGEDSFSYTV